MAKELLEENEDFAEEGFVETEEDLREEEESGAEAPETFLKSVGVDSGTFGAREGFRRYLHDIAKYQNLSAEEELELAKIKDKDGEDGEWAFQKLVNHNLRWVVRLAKRYINRTKMSFEDLVSCGNMGLITAVKKYDYRVGTRLTTYATWWIKMEIEKGIDMDKNIIAKPVHVIHEMKHLSAITEVLEKKLGRYPTIGEIVRASDGLYNENKVTDLMGIMMNNTMVSLDKPVGDEEDSTVGDFIEDEGASPEEYSMERAKHEAIMKVLSELKPVEQAVLEYRYGIGRRNGHEELTLAETSEEIAKIGFVNTTGECLSRERIRQIEARALDILRQSKVLQALA